jgi:hypothetical protein
MNPNSCIFGSRFACAQTTIFSAEPGSENAGETSVVHWVTACVVSKEFQHPAIQTKIELHFGGFFHEIKVCQPIERQDYMPTVIQTSRRLDSFLH